MSVQYYNYKIDSDLALKFLSFRVYEEFSFDEMLAQL